MRDIAQQIPKNDCGATLCIQPVARKLWARSAFPVLSHGGEYHVPSRIHSCCAHSTAVSTWSRRDHGGAAELRERASGIGLPVFPAARIDITVATVRATQISALRRNRRAQRGRACLLRGQSHDSGLAARARGCFCRRRPSCDSATRRSGQAKCASRFGSVWFCAFKLGGRRRHRMQRSPVWSLSG